MSEAKLPFWERMMPSQHMNRMHYTGREEAFEGRLYDLLAKASGVVPPAEDFELELTDVVPLEEMASNPLALRFLELLVRISGARRVLEIGAYIGLSTMTLARALPPGGKVITVERFDHFAAICRRNFQRNRLVDRIELLEGDAFEILPGLEGGPPFDLAFIDGNKERYCDHFLAVERLLRPGGLVVVDDAIFQGDALNDPPKSEKGCGVKRLMELSAARSDWLRSGLPVFDGMLLLVKP